MADRPNWCPEHEDGQSHVGNHDMCKKVNWCHRLGKPFKEVEISTVAKDKEDKEEKC